MEVVVETVVAHAPCKVISGAIPALNRSANRCGHRAAARHGAHTSATHHHGSSAATAPGASRETTAAPDTTGARKTTATSETTTATSDRKKAKALVEKIAELNKKMGPEFAALIDIEKHVDLNSRDGKEIASALVSRGIGCMLSRTRAIDHLLYEINCGFWRWVTGGRGNVLSIGVVVIDTRPQPKRLLGLGQP
jgi:hypothetical protein